MTFNPNKSGAFRAVKRSPWPEIVRLPRQEPFIPLSDSISPNCARLGAFLRYYGVDEVGLEYGWRSHSTL